MDATKKERVLAKIKSMPDDWTYKGRSKSDWIDYFETDSIQAAVLVAIRAYESFDRRTILRQSNFSTGLYGRQYGVNTTSPVMDMTNEDVYRFYSVFDIQINRAYEKMYDAGIPIGKMRIGSLFNTHTAGEGAKWMGQLDAGVYAKILTRVEGVNFASAYGGRTMSSKHISIPQIKPFNEGMPTKPQELAIELLSIPYKEVTW